MVPCTVLTIANHLDQAVKLQISPPSLTFTREMRTSLDVSIRFTPRATGVEVFHRHGHIFLLSDLFLVCERISPEDRTRLGHENADMWLCYPPLAGKVLRVSEVTGQGGSDLGISCHRIQILHLSDKVLQVAIMRKEFLILETNTKEERN